LPLLSSLTSSCPMGISDYFHGDETPTSWRWPLTPSNSDVQNARSLSPRLASAFLAWYLEGKFRI
jgi:hypothetical protein